MFMKLVRKDHIYMTEIAHKELKKNIQLETKNWEGNLR